MDGEHNMVPIQPTQKKPLMSRAWKLLSVLHEWWQASTCISPSVDVQQQMQDNPKVLETKICCNHADSPFLTSLISQHRTWNRLRNNIKQVKRFISEHGKNIKLVIYEVMCTGWVSLEKSSHLWFIQTHTHTDAPLLHLETFHDSVVSSCCSYYIYNLHQAFPLTLFPCKTSLGETDGLASTRWPLEKALFTLCDKSQGWWCKGSVVVSYYTQYTAMN